MQIRSAHFSDDEGNPTGGTTFGPGFTIGWQYGLICYENEKKAQNGAVVEDVLSACVDRLEFYQTSKFKCEENFVAISHIKKAIESLIERKVDRVKRGVGGTYKI